MDNIFSRFLILMITVLFILLGLPLTLFADITDGIDIIAPSHGKITQAQHQQTPISTDNTGILILQKLQNSLYWKNALRNSENREFINTKVIPYLMSMYLDPESKAFAKLIGEMSISSLQYINCTDPNDWECLESPSPLKANAIWRQDTKNDLGVPLIVNAAFQAEIYFTNRWKTRVNPQIKIDQKSVADILAEKIQTEAEESMYLALYGIDDIENSMRNVYEAIRTKILNGVRVLGVFDVTDEGASNSFVRDYDVSRDGDQIITQENKKLDFAYQFKPINQNSIWAHPRWMDELPQKVPSENNFVGPLRLFNDVAWLIRSPEKSQAIRLTFQYNNTIDLIRLMNLNIPNSAQASARIEYPFQGIMHNKFIVFKNKSGMSLWSGTANIAQTCMGNENNSNTSLFVKNPEVAQIFAEEFYEMHTPVQESTNEAVAQTSVNESQNNAQKYSGRFHDKKTPNTKRYLKFADSTDVRIYFSPTDDAEHRAIIPMLRSANPGDQVRIAMFGAGGIELVRALQSAVCRQVDIKIVLDRLTGSGNFGILKNQEGHLYNKNPYCDNPAAIGMHLAAWPERGLNHNKVGTLARKLNQGYRAEVMIIGSQNWSEAGNNLNDENVIEIRNRSRNLEIASKFNEEFDQYLYPLSAPYDPTAVRVKKSKPAKRKTKDSPVTTDVQN
jgi:phosphatidylserine/phosphatidylglycerophosphate/cardiolipin synthase-like enzyme